jgi:DNA-binding MarR family transcriptional regulator
MARARPVIQDAETIAGRLPENGNSDIRLWLRLLTCTKLIEGHVRSRLRQHFQTTLPRFDLMAQLEREPKGLRLSDLSRRMMVTNGNVTGLVDRLSAEGLVGRRASTQDRRVVHVHLTVNGRAVFANMARDHEKWITQMFGELEPRQVDRLMELLSVVKSSVKTSVDAAADGPGTDVD